MRGRAAVTVTMGESDSYTGLFFFFLFFLFGDSPNEVWKGSWNRKDDQHGCSRYTNPPKEKPDKPLDYHLADVVPARKEGRSNKTYRPVA